MKKMNKKTSKLVYTITVFTNILINNCLYAVPCEESTDVFTNPKLLNTLDLKNVVKDNLNKPFEDQPKYLYEEFIQNYPKYEFLPAQESISLKTYFYMHKDLKTKASDNLIKQFPLHQFVQNNKW